METKTEYNKKVEEAKQCTLFGAIKELSLIGVKVPPTHTLVKELTGTEFGGDVNTIYSKQDYRRLKEFIKKIVSAKRLEEQKKKRDKKVYFYVSIGGTVELNNQFKIDISDHILTKTISPKGCDKYCTENQTGKPCNWIRMPAILLPMNEQYESIRKWLNTWNDVEKVSNDVYRYKGDMTLFDWVKNHLLKAIYGFVLDEWFTFKTSQGEV